MRGRSCTVLLLAFLLAGCTDTQDPDSPESETGTTTSDADVADAEFGGANVTWVGRGEVTFAVNVPAGTDALWASWWSSSEANGGTNVMGNLHMDGCADDPQIGGSGAAVGHRWCEDPPAGNHTLTWTVTAGVIDGRVCIKGPPSGGFGSGNCLYKP